MPTSRRRTAAVVVASGAALSVAATTLYSPASGLDLDLDLLGINLNVGLGGAMDLDVVELGRVGGVGAEIVAYDKKNQRAWVTDAIANKVSIVNVADAAAPAVVDEILLSTLGVPGVATVTSVAISGKNAVVGTRPDGGQGAGAPGKVLLFDLDGNLRDVETAGFGPDAVTFTPDGYKVLIANEGEPVNHTTGPNPEGSVSIIDVNGNGFGINRQVTFTSLTTLPAGVRRSGPGTIAQDLEPEYVTVTENSRTAFVSLQENNAVAEIDILRAKLEAIRPAGYIDRSQVPLDASDQDGGINIRTYPGLLSMRMPDGLASFTQLGRTYYLTANEGDVREWPGVASDGADEERIGSSLFTGLTPAVWGDSTATAALRANAQLGRLAVSEVTPWGLGPTGPMYAFGGRSFSIFDDKGTLVYDSGAAFEQITAGAVPNRFNASLGNPAAVDGRSDDKGPEPEGVATAVVFGRQLAVVTLERTGGIMVYDVTDPKKARFVDYVPGVALDQPNPNPAPEGVQIVEQGGKILVLVASEGDGANPGALTIYQIKRV